MLCHWRKSNNQREGNQEQKFDVAFGATLNYSEQSLELVSVFKEASRSFILIFLFNLS
jgi:hypothetical protein